MARYKYKALTQDGKSVEGVYEARSKDDVLVMLRQSQYYPIKIEEKAESREINIKKIFQRVSIKDIAVFCRQFQAMLQAGVTLISCLDILRQQTENKTMRRTVAEVYEKVQQGYTLAESLHLHNDVFPELLINMVVAGEASGNLDDILDRMATHYEKENKIRNKIRGAMAYPIVLAVVAVLVVIFLLVYILPQFIGLFESSGAALPLPTRILIAISNFISGYWYLALAMVAAIVVTINMMLRNEKIRFKFDSYKFRMPIIKGITQKLITSRFSRTLATLLASGMPLMQALDIVGKIVNNKLVEHGIANAKEDVRRGVQLSVPIRNMEVFPPMLVSMLAIGEEAGAIDDILNRTANYYDDEAEAALEAMTKLVEPIMLVIMAVIIGSIVASIIMPVFDMMNNIAV